jgi:hypothetical protein
LKQIRTFFYHRKKPSKFGIKPVSYNRKYFIFMRPLLFMTLNITSKTLRVLKTKTKMKLARVGSQALPIPPQRLKS